MNLDINGRNFPITDALRKTVEDRMEQLLDRESLKITSGKVVLSEEKGRFTANIVVSYKNHDAAATAVGFDMYQVIDEAVGKIDRQMGDFLDKVQSRKSPPLRDVTAPTEPMPEK